MEEALQVVTAAEKFQKLILASLRETPFSGERVTLIAAYLDTALEHYEAVAMLIRAGLYGSAFALARSLYDTALRAFWVAACATSEQVVRLLRYDDPNDIPPAGQLRSTLDKAFHTKQFQNTKPEWTALCSYAHSGLRQLARRSFRGAKQHGYSQRAIIEIIDLMTSSLASIARVYFAACGDGMRLLLVSTAENQYYKSRMEGFVQT